MKVWLFVKFVEVLFQKFSETQDAFCISCELRVYRHPMNLWACFDLPVTQLVRGTPLKSWGVSTSPWNSCKQTSFEFMSLLRFSSDKAGTSEFFEYLGVRFFRESICAHTFLEVKMRFSYFHSCWILQNGEQSEMLEKPSKSGILGLYIFLI